MPIASHAEDRIVPTARLTWRGVCAATVVAACAVLAGCAGADRSRQAEDESWRIAQYYADDPIGALLQRQQIRPARRAGGGQASHSPEPDPPASPAALADTAMQMLGIRYRWGGDDPSVGFDCSGLVAYAAEQSLGLRLPRRADEIARLGQPVDRSELQAGDLVFFNTLGRRYSHVGIYLGEGRFVHAPSAGGVVRVERMDMHYWAKRYNGARRLMAMR